MKWGIEGLIEREKRLLHQKVPSFKRLRHRHTGTHTRHMDLKTVNWKRRNGSQTGGKYKDVRGSSCLAGNISCQITHPRQGRIQMGGNIFHWHQKGWLERIVTDTGSVVSVCHSESNRLCLNTFAWETGWILMSCKLLSPCLWFGLRT